MAFVDLPETLFCRGGRDPGRDGGSSKNWRKDTQRPSTLEIINHGHRKADICLLGPRRRK